MIRITGMTLPLNYTEQTLQEETARILHIPLKQLKKIQLAKKSVDARHKTAIVFTITVDVTVEGDEQALITRCKNPQVQKYIPAPRVIAPKMQSLACPPVVVGSGPAGLFAALTLAQAGLQPLLLERGQDVNTRQADVELFRLTGVLKSDSNVQFGEGGAGTFSDGKLNTGIKDPRCRSVIQQFAACGAPESILWEAKPHVGTDRLRQVVKGMRAKILHLGGQVRFGWQVIDLLTENGHIRGLRVQTPEGEQELACEHVILAIGHSARDTLSMLCERGLPMEQKPFAVGVRIEHPRTWIDRSQYGTYAGHPALGAADYKLSCRPIGGRGVYTFCMCPGGVVIAAASEEGGLVVNGMSEFSRDAANSNSALLVGVNAEDYGSSHPLAGVDLQRQMEQAAFRLGGSNYHAPVQLVGDFLARRASATFGDVQPSYLPGVTPTDLRECLPTFVADSLQTALPALGRQLAGFDRYDAVMTGIETRSSSPVRLLRDQLGSSAIAGIYPCGEGAGYAGGIISAAVDGIHAAENLMAAAQL